MALINKQHNTLNTFDLIIGSLCYDYNKYEK